MQKHRILCALIFVSAILATAQPVNQEARNKEYLRRFPEADLNKDGTLTIEEVRAFRAKRQGNQQQTRQRPQRSEPTHADIAYGSHPQQAFDIWLAKSETPTPVCVFIHGGGFRGGDKKNISGAVIRRFLDKGITFVSMNYRLTNEGEFPYPVPMEDSAMGLQFVRSKASEWNLDPERFVCYGGSAGAGISLWLAFRDDMADPKSKDPVARQSTRILAAGTTNGQSTYDMRDFREWFGVPDLYPESALFAFYNVKDAADFDSPRARKLAWEASSIHFLTKDDPPVYMMYSRENTPVTKETSGSTWVHHPLLGLKLQEAMHKLGLECTVVHKGLEDDKYKDLYDFLIQKLKE